MNVQDFFRDYIGRWEGGLSVDPDDRGNWCSPRGCRPILVGSNHGVTGTALACYRGVPSVTAADMRALTLDEAARIGEQLYYRQPHLDVLPFDPLVASVVDFGWGAGAVQAIKLLQRQIGAQDDGRLAANGETAQLYQGYVARHGIVAAASTWAAIRNNFYRLLAEQHPTDGKFVKGWMNRTAYFAPGGEWWGRFTANMQEQAA